MGKLAELHEALRKFHLVSRLHTIQLRLYYGPQRQIVLPQRKVTVALVQRHLCHFQQTISALASFFTVRSCLQLWVRTHLGCKTAAARHFADSRNSRLPTLHARCVRTQAASFLQTFLHRCHFFYCTASLSYGNNRITTFSNCKVNCIGAFFHYCSAAIFASLQHSLPGARTITFYTSL